MDNGQSLDDAGRDASGGEPLVALDPERLGHWIDEAQPGARLCYYSGSFAGEGSERLNERLRAEAGRGMLYLVQRRRRGLGGVAAVGFDYLAIRSSRPANPDGNVRPIGRRAAIWDQARHEAERGFRSSGR